MHKAVCHQMKCNLINEVKLNLTVFFDIIQSDLALKKLE